MISVGDIANSKFYLEIEKMKKTQKFNICFRKTYYGTKYGFTMFIGKLFIMSHVR